MQVTETLAEGLRRELKVTVPAADLEADIEGRLDELRKTVTMKGFRRGKVPLSIVRRQYQPRVLGEGAAADDRDELARGRRGA